MRKSPALRLFAFDEGTARWTVSIRFTDFNAARMGRPRFGQIGPQLVSVLGLLLSATSSFAQAPPQSPQAAISVEGAAPLTITLQDALHRARQNDPQFRSALTDLGLAREDRVQARAGLLPNLSYNNSFIYTQGTGPQPAGCALTSTCGSFPRFIANNGVHEYRSEERRVGKECKARRSHAL